MLTCLMMPMLTYQYSVHGSLKSANDIPLWSSPMLIICPEQGEGLGVFLPGLAAQVLTGE